MKISEALSIAISALSLAGISQAEEIFQVHGSGTTNPSKCIWHIISLFNERSRDPIRMTYRAVGSSTGQLEFLGFNSTGDLTHKPHNDFGAGDIPVSTEKWQRLKDEGNDNQSKMVHLPFALSSVSFFYDLNGVDEIDLDACQLAKIFNGGITEWNHPDLVASNPGLAGKDTKITVCTRTYGSSSTKSITKFLNLKCDKEWSSDLVGSVIDWPKDVKKVEGSGGMVKCLNENNGAIGYLESGHGWSEGLSEISLQNRDGRYVTSKHAFENGGIAGAANDANTPTDMRADWGNVEFIDKGGMNTFPIVLMSYVYVRTDIASHVSNEYNRGLLKLFLESLYKDEYIGKCKALAFTPPPEKVKEIATGNKGIKAIKWEFSTDNGENPWQFEIDTQKKIGANRYTISSKRKSYQGIELEDILTADERAIKDIQELYKLAEMELGFKPFTAREEKRINDATILGALSLALWSVVIVGLIVAKFINII